MLLAITRISLILAVIGLAFGSGYFYRDKRVTGEIIAAQDEAKAETKRLQDKADEITKKQIADRDAIAVILNDELVRMRNRPSRADLPGNTETHCKGATGRELSKPDAEFLTRLAARAERHRKALIACYKYADSLQN